jgi:hypothetical protein
MLSLKCLHASQRAVAKHAVGAHGELMEIQDALKGGHIISPIASL